MFEDFEAVVGSSASAGAAMAQWQADLIAAITGTDSAVMQAVATEATRAGAAEVDLQSQVSNLLVEGTIPAVGTERTERIAADADEASTRAADDVALGARIDAEEATRAQADTDEATARDAADELLDGRLDTIETAGYITQGPLTAEASARQAADALEATTRADADTTEIAARDSAISTHAGLKRGVHGIPGTVSAGQAIVGDGSGGFSAVDVATQAEQDAAIASEVSSRNSAIGSAVAAHESDTTNVHGIADTSALATAASVASAVSAETSRATTAEGLAALKASNLSDLPSASSARTNLGLGSAATQASSAFDTAGAAASEATRATAAEALLATKAQERLALAGVPDALITGAVTRDSNGAATSAAVTWPDGSPGTYTATTVSTAFPGAVDAYTITYGSPVTATYTQAAVTRDPSTGAVTNRPAITVS